MCYCLVHLESYQVSVHGLGCYIAFLVLDAGVDDFVLKAQTGKFSTE